MKLGTLCYLRKEGKTLMIYRNKKDNDYHEGKYNGLGGKFLPGETPEECAIREVQEESGLVMRNPRLHGCITFPLFDGRDDWYVFIFTCGDFSGRMIDSPEGYLEWVNNDNLLQLPLWEGDRIFLPWLEKDNFFSAIFNYQDKHLVSWDVRFY
ncbi:MAG: 8-oxo-dGTP diphosphatase [Candidatus Cloacimonetes bacterium]|nr:8-oxo-dGTP diphosphatase [Candidatus Cloacimonadota bacterium]